MSNETETLHSPNYETFKTDLAGVTLKRFKDKNEYDNWVINQNLFLDALLPKFRSIYSEIETKFRITLDENYWDKYIERWENSRNLE